MKSKLVVWILVAFVLFGQGIAFAASADKSVPVVEEDVVAIAEDAKTGEIEEVVEADELYVSAEEAVKAESKETVKK